MQNWAFGEKRSRRGVQMIFDRTHHRKAISQHSQGMTYATWALAFFFSFYNPLRTVSCSNSRREL
jgi:hypothetical protein